jgi:hypothetical protein
MNGRDNHQDIADEGRSCSFSTTAGQEVTIEAGEQRNLQTVKWRRLAGALRDPYCTVHNAASLLFGLG